MPMNPLRPLPMPSRFPEKSAVQGPLAAALACLCWLAACLTARAQEVTALLSPPVIGAGQVAEYSISVEGGQIQQLPANLEVPGLQFSGPISRSQMSMVQGVMRQQMEFVWQVYAPQPGTYRIPPQQLVVSGQTFTTPEKTLRVQEGPGPQESLDPFLRLQVAESDLYVGEVVPVTVTAFFHRRTQLRNYEHPKLPRENFVVKRFPPPGPSPSMDIEGERYQPLVFSSSLSAIREGTLTLGPAELECTVDFPIAEGRSQAPQFPSFFQRMMSRQVSLKSEPVTLRVRPLPEEGRPAGFAGAVGRFTLSASLSQPPQVRVGDPLALDLIVAGVGNFDTLPAPALSQPEGWRSYPARLSQENRSLGLDPGAVTFSQVIIPTRMADAVPAFELSFFDPATERYQTVRTEPIALQMAPAEEAGSAEPAPAARDFGSDEAATPEEQLEEILARRPERGRLVPLSGARRDESIFWAVQALPALLILVFAGVGAQRRLRAAAEERRRLAAGDPRPTRLIWKDLKRPRQPARHFYELAREFIDSWQFHSGRGAAAPALAGDIQRILQRQTLYSYGGAPEASIPVPGPERQRVLTVLSRLGRS